MVRSAKVRIKISVWVVVALAAMILVMIGAHIAAKPHQATTIKTTSTCPVNFNCWADYFRNYAASQGVLPALKTLAADELQNSYIRTNCHELAHQIGHQGIKMYPTAAAAISAGNETCASGYAHGVIEDALAKIPADQLSTAAVTICGASSANYSFAEYNCDHAIGHGLMLQLATNRPSAIHDDLLQALSLCDQQGFSVVWQNQDCYAAVFMQNAVTVGRMGLPGDVQTGDTNYPCNAVGSPYQLACFSMTGLNAINLADGAVAKGLPACMQVPADNQASCVSGTGRALGELIDHNLHRLNQLCSSVSQSLQMACYSGAVLDAVYGQRNPSLADAICGLTADHSACESLKQTATNGLK